MGSFSIWHWLIVLLIVVLAKSEAAKTTIDVDARPKS